MRPIRCESRDDLRRTLEARGVEVLADDDRLARRHRARAERARQERPSL